MSRQSQSSCCILVNITFLVIMEQRMGFGMANGGQVWNYYLGKALCVVWYIKITLHTMGKLVRSSLIQHLQLRSLRYTPPNLQTCACQWDDHWGQGRVTCRLYGASKRDKETVYPHCLTVFNSSPNSCTVSLCKPLWAPKYFKLYALKNATLETKSLMECVAVFSGTSYF